ncbi:hypothetical protein SP90_12940 [Halodesulfovibrio spirochaetisodalis]|uniref:DUF3833 domain-containing protein n=2 Tax=Halodesulfovibrio spirochaetisodalis TaxID=1560234 RepID=A0A1B7XAB4_9BACT|nr:hypothetical protein SP90_12940 [Halodesulfovibrio spirochaetisodalis]
MNDHIILEDFFQGELDCHGVLIRRNGDIWHRFAGSLNAEWTPDADGMLRGVMHETITFSSGDTRERIWKLTKENESGYISTADDLEGLATITIRGFEAIAMYRMKIPTRAKEVVVDVEDMMWLTPGNVMMSKAILRKLGVRIGEIITVLVPVKKINR